MASGNILAGNNNPLEDFFLRFLFCYKNKQLLEHMYGQKAHAPFYSNSIIYSISISPTYFYENIFCVKSSEMEEIVVEK